MKLPNKELSAWHGRQLPFEILPLKATDCNFSFFHTKKILSELKPKIFSTGYPNGVNCLHNGSNINITHLRIAVNSNAIKDVHCGG